MDSYDVIVVGVGGTGSGAVAHLAERGRDVLGLERLDVPNDAGSAHAVTRAVRLPQHEDSAYVPLARRALELWERLDERHADELFHRTGSLALGPPDGAVFERAKASCDAHDVSHQVLTGRDLTERVGGYDVPDGYRAVYQPDGGFLDAEQCVVAHTALAHDHGATVRARERVVDWSAEESGVRVSTDRGDYTADALVVAAGAWTGQLFPSIAEHLRPGRQVFGWFQPAEPATFAPDGSPVFVADTPEGRCYGCPAYEVPGVKVGTDRRREPDTPPLVHREPTQDDEERLRAFTERHLPAGDGPTMGLSTCPFASGRDGDFLLDTHPDHANVVVGAGFGGRALPFASVLGEALADLATGTSPEFPTERFGLARFE